MLRLSSTPLLSSLSARAASSASALSPPLPPPRPPPAASTSSSGARSAAPSPHSPAPRTAAKPPSYPTLNPWNPETFCCLPDRSRRASSPLTRDVVAQKQLWGVVDVSYEQSRRLLQETKAAVRLLDSAGGSMDFSGLDTVVVESAINCVSGGSVIKGQEALAVVSLMLFVESLQVTIRAAMKQDEDSHNLLMPLTETILDAVVNKSLVKSIQDIIDDDGSVKDTASPELRQYREQVQALESRLCQLMDKLIRNADNEASLSEVSTVNGRCCIKITGDKSESSPLDCARCGKPASLQCPKCVQLKLPREAAAFCSQNCFKAAWISHKSVHTKLDALTSQLSQEGWKYCLRKGRTRTLELPRFDWTGPLRPFPISKMRSVPDEIEKPDWALDGIPKIEPDSDLQKRVEIKTPEQIERMKETCRIAREVLDAGARVIKPGITTDEIDRVIHEETIARGGYPSPLNYHFFPKSCCTSVNEVICHGIPDARKLEDGDIVNIDVTVYYKGVHGDLNDTYFVGNVDEASKQLVRCTYECLEKAIAIVKPGVRFREV